MPAKRQLLSSSPGRNELLDISDPDAFDSRNSPRRRPTAVPGERLPFLASTGRQTTSSRGGENTFRVRSPLNLQDQAVSTPSVLPSQATNQFPESRNDYATPLSDSWHMTLPAPLRIPRSIEGSLSHPTLQNAQPLDLESPITNNMPLWSDISDWGFIGPQPDWSAQISLPASNRSHSPFASPDSSYLDPHPSIDFLTPSSFGYNTPSTNSDLLQFHAARTESHRNTSISPMEQELSPAGIFEDYGERLLYAPFSLFANGLQHSWGWITMFLQAWRLLWTAFLRPVVILQIFPTLIL